MNVTGQNTSEKHSSLILTYILRSYAQQVINYHNLLIVVFDGSMYIIIILSQPNGMNYIKILRFKSLSNCFFFKAIFVIIQSVGQVGAPSWGVIIDFFINHQTYSVISGCFCGTAVNNAKLVANGNNSFRERTLPNNNGTTTTYTWNVLKIELYTFQEPEVQN
jgi:hypothetical protein